VLEEEVTSLLTSKPVRNSPHHQATYRVYGEEAVCLSRYRALQALDYCGE